MTDGAAGGEVPAHFRDDVLNKASAEGVLRESEPKAYITWRESAASFYMTYKSSAFKNVQHIPLKRVPDGSFVCTELADGAMFPSLNEFVASRSFVDPHARVHPAAGDVDGDATRQRRADARFSGTATLPQDIKPPAAVPQVARDNARYRIDPVLPPLALNAVLAATALLAAGMAAISLWQHRSLSPDVHAHAAHVAEVTLEGVNAANAALATSMLRHVNGSGVLDGAACVEVMQAWRGDMVSVRVAAQAAFDAHADAFFVPYVHLQLMLAFTGACVCILLAWVNTGSRNLEFRMGDYANEQEAMAALGGKADPPCTAMQFRWSATFTLVMAASACAAVCGVSTLWAYGEAGHHVEYAARPFSSLHMYDKHGPQLRRAAAGADIMWQSEETPWHVGEYASAWAAIPVTDACIESVQPYVRDLVENPALLRVPVAALSSLVARALAPHAAQAETCVTMDALATRDPFAASGTLHGTFDAAQLVVPSTTRVARSTMLTAGVLLSLLMISMIGSDVLYGMLQPCRRRCARSRVAAAKHEKAD